MIKKILQNSILFLLTPLQHLQLLHLFLNSFKSPLNVRKNLFKSFSDKISQVFSSKDNHRLKITLIDINNNKKSQNQPSEISTNKVDFNSNDQPYEDFINKAIQEMKD